MYGESKGRFQSHSDSHVSNEWQPLKRNWQRSTNKIRTANKQSVGAVASTKLFKSNDFARRTQSLSTNVVHVV
jgi:hypothetical protein